MSNPISLDEKGIALQGYDPVSYFSDSPVKGDPQISSTYEGATYLFSSQENKAQFESAPQQYIPQYGSYCAVAVSEGKLVPVDPETYKVTDGKLYLFYNGEHGNTKPQWEADEETLRTRADDHWQKGDLTSA
ncbi:YHS domain-containing (seleno)protein [Myxosarcina sp. GI1(2024)]